jgi:hypothetical protein
MSETLTQVIERASVDAAFRARLQNDPAGALAGYSLTAAERAAVLSGDPRQIEALDVETRVTKVDNPREPGDVYPNNPWGGSD